MGLRVSLPCATINQARSPSSQLLKFSTSTQRIILAENQVRANAHRRYPPWTVLNASRTTSDSNGTVSTARSLADLVSKTIFLSYLLFQLRIISKLLIVLFFHLQTLACPDYLRMNQWITDDLIRNDYLLIIESLAMRQIRIFSRR